jgi:hypothetical protein
VDIEGAEPLLAPAIAGAPGRIHAAYVEISRYNTLEAYLALVRAFDTAGLTMLGADNSPTPDPALMISAALETGPSMNAWFLRRDYLDAARAKA